MRNRGAKGFAHLFLLLIVLVVIIATFLVVYKKNVSNNGRLGGGKCQGTGSVPLTASPIVLDQLDSIAPMGNMVGDHVTPSDHLGFASKNPSTDTPIHAMADGFVKTIVYTKEPSKSWYGVLIEHSCTFYSNQFLLSNLTEPLKSALGGKDSVNVRIPVKSSQVIGSLRDHGMDYSLIDLNSKINFIDPGRWGSQSTKIHVVDPFDYYQEPLKSQMLAKDLREASPRGGTINYDKAGTLAGNWFKAGTKATNDEQKDAVNELTFGYDFIDPRLIKISIGDYQGKSTQFNAANNTPDPKTIKVGQLVKYGLAGSDYRLPNGQSWDRMHAAAGLSGFVTGQTNGTIMVQLLSDKRLKLEVFPGVDPSAVSGFTAAARIYER